MAIAKDLINRSRRLIGSLGRGEVATDAEYVDDLYALNSYMDQLWIDKLAVFNIQEESLTVTTISHTVGPTGDTVIVRPVTIESAVQTDNNIDYPINVLTEPQYRIIAAKTVTSTIISDLYYEPLMPDGKLFFYPVPSTSVTVKIRSRARIEAFTILETISLPPGYEDMLAYNLAVNLAPEYQRQVPPVVATKAATTLANIKRLNHAIPQASTDIGRRYDIYADV